MTAATWNSAVCSLHKHSIPSNFIFFFKLFRRFLFTFTKIDRSQLWHVTYHITRMCRKKINQISYEIQCNVHENSEEKQRQKWRLGDVKCSPISTKTNLKSNKLFETARALTHTTGRIQRERWIRLKPIIHDVTIRYFGRPWANPTMKNKWLN